MNIKDVAFVGSYTDYKKCPEPVIPEYAFIGRSNVGKSSLINMLVQRNELAHVSKEPGKTRSINYFGVNFQNPNQQSWYLVDMPGYGYAKLPKTLRAQWEDMTEQYMRHRPNLQAAFLLIDSCVPPQPIDIAFANKLAEWQTPFILVFTKTDRKKSIQNQKEGFLKDFEAEMLKTWEAMPQYLMTSSEIQKGRIEILDIISEINNNYKKPE